MDLLEGMHLDLGAAERTILVGEPIDLKRGMIYTALLDHGTFPALPPRRRDNALSYLQRCAKALGTRYEAPFILTFTPVDCVLPDHWDERDVPDTDALAVTICIDHPPTIRVARFHAQLTARSRSLCASLFAHLTRAARPCFDVFTPGLAYSVSEWVRFGDASDWWFQMRDQASRDLGIDEKTLDGVRLRRYIRESGITTPGMLSAQLGAHHVRMDRHDVKILSMDACAHAIALLPRTMRKKARAMLAAAQEVAACSKLIENLNTNDGTLLNDLGAAPMPAFVFETNPHELVWDLLEELWQYVAQDRGFAPHYAFAMRASESSIRRLQQTLDAFARAYQAMQALAQVLHEE